MGYASTRYRTDGLAWVDRTLEEHQDWSARARTALLLAIPSDRPTWDRVEGQGVVQEYWARTRAYLGHGTTPQDIAYAISHLLGAGQVAQAFEQAGTSAQQTPTAALTQTLDAVLQALQEPQPAVGHLAEYYVVRILGALDTRADIDVSAIAGYEWAYLPLLRHDRCLRLHEHLASAPDLFAQMIASIHRPANGEPRPEPTEEEVARAHHAYDLLNSWHTIPGTRPDGSIDQDALFAWAAAARAACQDRLDSCDDQLGKVQVACVAKGQTDCRDSPGAAQSHPVGELRRLETGGRRSRRVKDRSRAWLPDLLWP